jgi:diaminohydroxyphosphoribosylaminopyrimidine deaminase/5-amino-6-(5-phosphoribosylamino)uracil reductase
MMALAVAAAESVRGTTSPNPPVGCVLVADGQVVGTGATAPPGGPHAEIVALRAAGGRARGATAYVTLEPCNHTGRTGPCARALAAAGVAAVYYAVADPNPKAAGGARALRDAGVSVHSGLSEADVRSGPLRAWLHYQRTGNPHITWKFAATLDGRSAAADGTSQWISSPRSRAEVHELRARMDAIVVGTATVQTDDPALTARHPDGTHYDHQPVPVVVGNRDLHSTAKLAGAIQLRTHDIVAVQRELVERGFVDVLLEGGPTLAGAFAEAGAIDRVIGYLAPTLLGAGANAFHDAGVSTITEALRLDLDSLTMSGPDIRFTATMANRTMTSRS